MKVVTTWSQGVNKNILKGSVLLMILLCFFIAENEPGNATTIAGHLYQKSPEYKITTFNIRRFTEADTGGRAWAARRPGVATLIKKYGFDLFGIQEPIGTQINDLVNDLPEYGRFGVSDHNDYAYQHQDIFYKKSMFSVLDSGKFWLAPGGPDSPPADTRPWDNYYHTEVVTWGKFKDKSTGFEFYVFNAHFEPGAKIAQLESAKLVLQKISSIANASAVILMGDLNMDQRSDGYLTLQNSELLGDTYHTSGSRSGVTPTFNNWMIEPKGDRRFDHIFTTSHFHPKKHTVLKDNYSGILPSDHFPVMVQMSVTK